MAWSIAAAGEIGVGKRRRYLIARYATISQPTAYFLCLKPVARRKDPVGSKALRSYCATMATLSKSMSAKNDFRVQVGLIFYSVLISVRTQDRL